MLSAKIHSILFKNKKTLPILLMFLFPVLFFSTRIPGIKNDIINPDSSLWHYRSEQFIVGIKNKQFEKTYQHYQPGTTLMWITGSAVEIFKKITGINSYDIENFQNFDLVSKISVISVQFVLSTIIILVLAKIIGFYQSFFTVSLFTFEPFFLANSRLYHMDVLLTLLLTLSIILGFLNMKEPKIWKSIIIGLLLGFSFLTKSISIGALLFVLFYTLIFFIHNEQKGKIIPILGLMLISFILTVFIFLPALWVKPLFYLSDIFSEVVRVGIKKGHDQILFGEPTSRAGLIFYPLVTLLKVSPFILVGLLFCFYYSFNFIKNIFKTFKKVNLAFFTFSIYFAIFSFGYIFAMSLPAKKVDRYILVIYPFLAYLAYIGFQRVYQNIKVGFKKKIFIVFLVIMSIFFWIFPIFKLYPWYFTYTSPLFGSPQKANIILAQKPFGVAIPLLKDTVVEKYYEGNKEDLPKLGFYDTQPMRAVYPNSKIFDVRVYGPSTYDILILGINEEMPEKILSNGEYSFEKIHSIWINGLEYWRIYNKITLSENNNGK
ncbi:MAG TPA: glycosyltransferase family 39 protein [bacterium]|nr:glycosyltransferase family 39 protein [bacterium]